MAEQSLKHINRAFRTTLNCYQAVFQAKTEKELLTSICRIITRDGGYNLAWVGYVEIKNDCTNVIPVASDMTNGGCPVILKMASSGLEVNENCVYSSVENMQDVMGKEICGIVGCRNKNSGGCCSLLALPLMHGDKVLGILAIQAKNSEVFNKDEVNLLKELSLKLTYGITALRAKEQKDLTEKELLKRNNELNEAKNAARLHMESLATISHELRNPLNTIMGFSELGPYKIRNGELEKAERFMEMIRLSAEHLRSLIDDLVDYSRIEAGEVMLRREVINIHSLQKELISQFHHQAAKKGVNLSMNIPLGIPDVFADRTRLIQVFYNLFTNALKFTPPGGKIIIEAFMETDIVFKFEDNGIGISQKDQKVIFERFGRAGREKFKQRGMGLGLTITKKLVEMHGGAIWLESVEGKGATFFFSLPIENRPFQKDANLTLVDIH